MTKIEWTEETWNPVVGCTRVPNPAGGASGCDNCYAVTMSHRLEAMGQERYAGLTVLNNRGDRHFNGVVRTVPEVLEKPLKWRKPRTVFVNSMGDLFHPAVPFEFIDRVWAVMALTPRHTYQILTKRPERMAEYLASFNGDDGCASESRHDRFYEFVYETWMDAGGSEDEVGELLGYPWPLPNVWLGTSCENQAAADARIPHLLRCPAAVRFLSCEPLLGGIDLRAVRDHDGPFARQQDALGVWELPVDVHAWVEIKKPIDWVIVGGESGKGARACDVAWIRSIVGQCRDAGVACFVKQLGARPTETGRTKEPTVGMGWSWDDSGEQIERWFRPKDRKGGDPAEWPEDLRVREMPVGWGARQGAMGNGE